MKFSTLFATTTKEEPKDCVLKSHSILIRGSFIKQIGSGIYSFLPLGKMVLDKVQKIIKEEMDKSGANEVRLGFVTPAELWEKSKRFDKYGKELLVFRDRKDNRFVLGPTHEESALDCIKGLIKSYKQLPLNIYQIHLKFRDEIRPRFGLMRAREFIMKDAYSFHANIADLDREFMLMEQTYRNIFDRLDVKYRVVDADSGAIGGSGSKEFMLLAESGEDDIVVCEKCEYASNIEAATRAPRSVPKSSVPQADFAKFYTPNVTTIKALSEFFKIDSYWTMKCVAKKAVFGRDLSYDNAFLGNHSTDSTNLECLQASSSHSKLVKNHENTPTIPSIANSANLKSKTNPSLQVSEMSKAIQKDKMDCHDFAMQNLAMTNHCKDSTTNTNSSIVSENQRIISETKQKTELRCHEQGNKTKASIDKASSKLSNLSPQDEFATAPCFFFIRGCDDLNLTKALNAIPNAIDLVDLPLNELESLGLHSGFIGAYGLQNITKSPYIYFDNELKDGANLICGANEVDYHFVGVDLGTFSNLQYADLIEVKKGDICPKCGGKLDITKGIELGHIFKLGRRYSEPLEATFLDSNGKAQFFEMGCYGIGVTRILPAILEQKADSKGAIWGNVAPFSLTIIVSNTKNDYEMAFATKIYDELCIKWGDTEILLDDRNERFGVKMADFELIGTSFALIIGKELQNGKVELINRKNLEREIIDLNTIMERIQAIFSNN